MNKPGSLGAVKELSIYDKMFEKDYLFECYRGSQSHGTYIPPEEETSTDDIDLMRVYRYPDQYYLTLESYHHNKEASDYWEEEYDIVEYEIKKMFKLLADCNPNVLCTLYNLEQDYLKLDPRWKYVRENRNVFVGKDRIKDAYGAYARDQFRKMEKFEHHGYMGKKRGTIVKKFGYDVKNASHLIRLLRMGIEFLKEGEPKIWRPDHEELTSIKKGEWTLAHVKREAKKLFKQLEIEYDKSALPEVNNKFKINKLLYEVMRKESWSDK